MTAAVELDAVTKTFGPQTAVDELSLRVPENSIYGFIGPNGSGKTTTLRMIMRILHPDRGHIRVLGEEAMSAANDRVGYLPEERGLYRQMTVRDVLRFFAALKGQPDARRDIVRVRLDGDGAGLDALPGVERVTDFGKLQELQLAPGADPQAVLAALMTRGRVRHFELTRPSLQEIFVRIARPEAEGVAHA